MKHKTILAMMKKKKVKKVKTKKSLYLISMDLGNLTILSLSFSVLGLSLEYNEL